MIARALSNIGSKALKPAMQQQIVTLRQMHKGPQGVPPMRWFSIPVGVFVSTVIECFAGKTRDLLVHLVCDALLSDLRALQSRQLSSTSREFVERRNSKSFGGASCLAFGQQIGVVSNVYRDKLCCKMNRIKSL